MTKGVGLGVGLALLLAACLFGNAPGVVASLWLGTVAREVLATFRDPGTQWMVFACCGMYFGLFTLLRQRTSGERFWRWGNADLWLTAALVLATLRYAFSYGTAASGTEALVLVGAAMLGKGIHWASGKWEERREKLAEGEHRTFNIHHSTSKAGDGRIAKEADRKIDDRKMDVPDRHFPVIIPVLLLLLVTAAFWQNESGMRFQYRGQARWSGPWENPNLFGMLTATGVVLALGMVFSLVTRRGEHTRVSSGECQGAGKSEVRSPKAEVVWWAKLALFLFAAGILGFGLVKSYSRGAWVGTICGLGWLAWEWWDRGIRGIREREEEVGGQRSDQGSAGNNHLTPACGNTHLIRPAATFCPSDAEKGEQGGEGAGRGEVRSAKCEVPSVRCEAEQRARASRIWRFGGLLRRNAVPFMIIVASVLVLGFWSFRHTEQAVARRVFSVGNVNDFSWRNRVAAWTGALQMMAERPWLGQGWNRPERLYEQYYRDPGVSEGTAIQLNDYLMLGASVGWPVLGCFLGYVGLCLASRQLSVVIRPGAEATDYKPLTTDLAKLTCRAGAVVLLIGFWFDGELFRLATASVFWVLLELGREESPRMARRDANLETEMREA